MARKGEGGRNATNYTSYFGGFKNSVILLSHLNQNPFVCLFALVFIKHVPQIVHKE